MILEYFILFIVISFRQRLCLIKDLLVSRKNKVPFSTVIEMWNSCTSVVPKLAWNNENETRRENLDIIIVSFWQATLRPSRSCRFAKKEGTIQHGYRNGELMHASIFPNTLAWEQQEWNKIKKQTKKVRREAWVWKEVKQARKNEVPTAYHYQIKIQ